MPKKCKSCTCVFIKFFNSVLSCCRFLESTLFYVSSPSKRWRAAETCREPYKGQGSWIIKLVHFQVYEIKYINISGILTRTDFLCMVLWLAIVSSQESTLLSLHALCMTYPANLPGMGY